MNRNIMETMGFRQLLEATVDKGLCPFCKRIVSINNFKRPESITEFKISGICEECQDEFFD